MPKRRLAKASPASDLPGLTAYQKAKLKRLTISSLLTKSRVELLATLPAISRAYARFRPQPMKLADANAAARALCAGLPAKSEAVGSLRRRKPLIGDLDFLIDKNHNRGGLLEAAARTAGGKVLAIFAEGPSKVSGIISLPSRIFDRRKSKRPVRITVDLFFAPRADWGSALLHFTGGREFNVRIRAAAKKKGKSLSQHGLRDLSSGEVSRFRSEKALMKAVGYRWHDPTER